jgi:hypothetical protein
MKTLFSILAVVFMLSLTGCGSIDESSCAEAVNGAEFCYEDRVYNTGENETNYADVLHKKSPAVQQRLADNSGVKEYAEELKKDCLVLAGNDFSSTRACDRIPLHASTKEEANMLYYRMLLYIEGTINNNFLGRIVTDYEPIFNQETLIRDFYHGQDREFTPASYVLAVKQACHSAMKTIREWDGVCKKMRNMGSLVQEVNPEFDLRKMADWLYIASVYELNRTGNAFDPDQVPFD